MSAASTPLSLERGQPFQAILWGGLVAGALGEAGVCAPFEQRTSAGWRHQLRLERPQRNVHHEESTPCEER